MVLLSLLGGPPERCSACTWIASLSCETRQEPSVRQILGLRLWFNFDIVTCYIYINTWGLFDIISLSPNGISSPNNYTGITIQKNRILGWLSLFRWFCQGEKKDNKDILRNEFCPLFSVLIIQLFFNSNF